VRGSGDNFVYRSGATILRCELACLKCPFDENVVALLVQGHDVSEVAVFGEFAYTRCRDSLSVKPRAGGEPMELAGHRMTIYRKQPGGRWLLARDAHTLSPVAR